MRVAFCFMLSFCVLAAAAEVADGAGSPQEHPVLTLSGSLGHLNAVAHERVYKRNGDTLSELVWDMEHALVLNGGVSLLASRWLSFYGNASVGLAASNTMNDYDWMGSPRPEQPNLHSWHDDTELDHYYTLDAGASVLLLEQGASRFSVLGGFKYTDIKWSAYGGCYNYKYFDVQGCFDDGVKVISYRQSLPAIYGGLSYAGGYERWTLALDGRLGMTLSGAEADDDHWLRNLTFVDHLNAAPYLALNGKAGYAVSSNADVFASVAFDKYFDMRGETSIRQSGSGSAGRSDYDSGGADLYTLNIALGVDYRF